MNLKYFPFDKHSCEIEYMHLPRYGINTSFGNCNFYEREGIVFQNDPDNANQQFLIENGEWELVSLTLDTTPQITALGKAVLTYPIYKVTCGTTKETKFLCYDFDAPKYSG